jgi:hypothetical protein
VPLSSFERDHELRRVRCPRFRSEFSARDRACASAPDPLIAGSGERLHRLVPHNLEHFAERGRAVLGRVPRASGSVIIERPARCRRRATSPDTGWASGENRLSGVWDVRGAERPNGVRWNVFRVRSLGSFAGALERLAANGPDATLGNSGVVGVS